MFYIEVVDWLFLSFLIAAVFVAAVFGWVQLYLEETLSG